MSWNSRSSFFIRQYFSLQKRIKLFGRPEIRVLDSTGALISCLNSRPLVLGGAFFIIDKCWDDYLITLKIEPSEATIDLALASAFAVDIVYHE